MYLVPAPLAQSPPQPDIRKRPGSGQGDGLNGYAEGSSERGCEVTQRIRDERGRQGQGQGQGGGECECVSEKQIEM